MKRILYGALCPVFFVVFLAAQQEFPTACKTGKPAHFPGAADAIDSHCGLDGTPDPKRPGDGPQNEAKNDFCGDTSTPAPIHLNQIASLEKDAETQEKNLGFKLGEPPAKRDFLKSMGEGNVVVFEGFVFEARQECAETVNCGSNPPNAPPNVNASHDIHIALLEQPRHSKPSDPPAVQNKEECTGFVAEMIPHHRPPEWTACNVKDVAARGLKVRVTGQQFFDGSHVPCANGAPQGTNPKRISLWEIHPIYSFEVCPDGDCAQGGWESMEEFAAGRTTCAEEKNCQKKGKQNTPAGSQTNSTKKPKKGSGGK